MPNEQQILRDTLRWFERAVIGLNLCPFAKAVHVKQLIRWRVTFVSSENELLAALETELIELNECDAGARDTSVLIHPNVLSDFWEYQQFVKRAERRLRALGLEGRLQLASFHPQYEFSDAPAGDITNYTNRSPYPMLHLLREASVSRAVRAFPDAAAIFETNRKTLRELGPHGWRNLFTLSGE